MRLTKIRINKVNFPVIKYGPSISNWSTLSMCLCLPDVSKNKVCSAGDPWGDVGGLWAVESDELHSDKSEKKLLTSNGSGTADYAEVDAGSLRVNDDLSKSRLGENGAFVDTPPSRTARPSSGMPLLRT